MKMETDDFVSVPQVNVQQVSFLLMGFVLVSLVYLVPTSQSQVGFCASPAEEAS